MVGFSGSSLGKRSVEWESHRAMSQVPKPTKSGDVSKLRGSLADPKPIEREAGGPGEWVEPCKRTAPIRYLHSSSHDSNFILPLIAPVDSRPGNALLYASQRSSERPTIGELIPAIMNLVKQHSYRFLSLFLNEALVLKPAAGDLLLFDHPVH